MMTKGRKIIIELMDGEVIQTSYYCGNSDTFYINRPDFIISVDMYINNFTVKINREDLNKFYDFIHERGTKEEQQMTPSQAIDHLQVIHPELTENPNVTARIIKEFLTLIDEKYLDNPIFAYGDQINQPILWNKIQTISVITENNNLIFKVCESSEEEIDAAQKRNS